MSEMRRLFFALWPSEVQQARWAEMAKQLLPSGVGRFVRPENLHITLLFVGRVSTEQAHCLDQLAATVQSEPFTLQLDHFGHWRRPQVWWWGAYESPQALLNVVQTLRTGSLRCGLEADQRPYQVHMTLARKVKRMPDQLIIKPEQWTVKEFVLVESVTASEGVQYQVQKRWPFICGG